VAQTRAATAGTGAMDYAGGNQATAQLGQANAAQYADRLAKSTGAAALGQGLQAGDQAAQAASAQYGNDDESLRRKIAELFGIVDVGNAADSVGRAQNESLGQSRMRHAQGVGNDSMQYGQLMQLGGLAYGAYQPQMANYWAQLFGQARPSTDLTNGGSAGQSHPAARSRVMLQITDPGIPNGLTQNLGGLVQALIERRDKNRQFDLEEKKLDLMGGKSDGSLAEAIRNHDLMAGYRDRIAGATEKRADTGVDERRRARAPQQGDRGPHGRPQRGDRPAQRGDRDPGRRERRQQGRGSHRRERARHDRLVGDQPVPPADPRADRRCLRPHDGEGAQPCGQARGAPGCRRAGARWRPESGTGSWRPRPGAPMAPGAPVPSSAGPAHHVSDPAQAPCQSVDFASFVEGFG
jgi:hypothetical protein